MFKGKKKGNKKGKLSGKEKDEEKLIKRLHEFDQYDEKNYAILFSKDEFSAKKEAINATTQEVDKQIEILIGSPNKWCTNSIESLDFRKKCHEIWLRNKRKGRKRLPLKGKRKKGKMSSRMMMEKEMEVKKEEFGILDLPRYVIPEDEPEPHDVETMWFLCGVHVDKGEQFESQTMQSIQCNSKSMARDFLKTILERANNVRKKDSPPLEVKDWVLKVTGSLEYVHGDIELFKFESIRRALKYGKAYIELNLMRKDTELAKMDMYQKVLEKINYNIDKEFLKPVDHDKISMKTRGKNVHSMKMISLRDVKTPFKLYLNHLTVFNDTTIKYAIFPKNREKHAKQVKCDFDNWDMFVYVQIVHGDFLLGQAYSKALPFSTSGNFNEELTFNSSAAHSKDKKLVVCDLPRESTVLLTVYCRKRSSNKTIVDIKEKDQPLGSISFCMIDYQGYMKAGWRTFFLNIGRKANLWSYGEGDEKVEITVKLTKYALPVIYPTHGSFDDDAVEKLKSWENILKYKHSIIKGKDLLDEMDKLIRITPIKTLSEKQKWIIWNSRDTIIQKYPELLPKFLLSVPWDIPQAVQKTHEYLAKFPPLPPLKCLELLDYKFPDQRIRIYAVKQLMKLKSQELFHYILQLAQTIKFELYHDSALSRFLLQRGLNNNDIGQSLFWYLKSEMHIPSIKERYGLMLEEFLRRCAGFRIELLKQNCVLEQLYKVALQIKGLKKEKKDVKNDACRKLLKAIKFPPKFKLPLTYRVELNGIDASKCRVMSSAKLPLFLYFTNVDKFSKERYVVLYKAGDDLKQDVLVLQMLRIMDNLWKRNGMDLHIRAYGCIATGDLTGLVEIVTKSETTADIANHKGFGSIGKTDIITKWLTSVNAKADYQEMRKNFMLSCAGYCVASYILGLGDRHNDNVMISKKGDLFHIDFGHFLNHRKKFLGFKRETAPFVFTTQFANVLDYSKNNTDPKNFYNQFVELAIKSYNMLRKETNLLIVLLMLMMGCGLIEMQSEDDIEWVENAMVLGKDDHTAGEFFRYLIQLAMSDKRQTLNDKWHILYHKVIKN